MRARERCGGAFMRAPGAAAGGRLCGENPRDSQPFCGTSSLDPWREQITLWLNTRSPEAYREAGASVALAVG